MKRRNKQLLAENEYVKELLAVLKENPSPSGKDFAEMVAHVGELENRLAEAVEELRTMRQELLQVQNRSLKAVLQRSCKALEQNISNMSRKLSELKKLIMEGVKKPLLPLRNMVRLPWTTFPAFFTSSRCWRGSKRRQTPASVLTITLSPKSRILLRSITRRAGI